MGPARVVCPAPATGATRTCRSLRTASSLFWNEAKKYFSLWPFLLAVTSMASGMNKEVFCGAIFRDQSCGLVHCRPTHNACASRGPATEHGTHSNWTRRDLDGCAQRTFFSIAVTY